MKKIAIIILMSLSVAMGSCKKDDDTPSSSNNVTNTQSLPGNWKVSYYYDDKDETSDYAGYTFEFTSDGKLNAITSSQTFEGSWQTTVDDNLPRLVISLSGNEDLVELSDDWVIVNMSNTEISLRDDNLSQTDELHFTKIN